MGNGGGLAEAKLLGPTKDMPAALIRHMTERLVTRKPLHEGEKPEEQMRCANKGRNEGNMTMILK
jgi:hypothetical protein